MLWLWILIVVVAFIAIVFFVYYNRFVRLKNQIENALAQIDVQLRKRADLVPNLMNSVKGYVKHEKAIFKELTDARKAILSAKDISKRVKAGNEMQQALKSIFAMAESNPQLKANENFLHLQQELSAIEDKVAYARQYYNDGIMQYNLSLTTVPGKWFASMYGFGKEDYLKIPAEKKAVPKVEF